MAICLWLGWFVNRVNQQRQTVQWVTELGGFVRYDYENPLRIAELPGPDWLRNLIGIDYFANVVMVDLSGAQVNDLTPLANLKNLETLYLSDTPVSDVKPLANLTKLKRLILNTQVSDVTPLTNLKNLKILKPNNALMGPELAKPQ